MSTVATTTNLSVKRTPAARGAVGALVLLLAAAAAAPAPAAMAAQITRPTAARVRLRVVQQPLFATVALGASPGTLGKAGVFSSGTAGSEGVCRSPL